MIARLRFWTMLAGALLVAGAWTPVPASAGKDSLATIHQNIIKRYKNVEHMTAEELTRTLDEKGDDIVLIDVREVNEYGVSHLNGAARIDPGVWRRTFMRKFGPLTKGKTVVFYCSVGRRSSRAADYLQDALKKNGAKSVYNLQGGIFNWHNQSRPLRNIKGSTEYIHPFNSYWGRLVERKQMIRNRPADAYKPGS